VQKKDKNKVTLTYQVKPEDRCGYYVQCLNWPNMAYTQGENLGVAKRMAADVTEMVFGAYFDNILNKSEQPDFETNYKNTKNRFQLTFDKKTGKHIPEKEAVS